MPSHDYYSLLSNNSSDYHGDHGSAGGSRGSVDYYAYPKQRLYAAVPGREFVCVRSFRPQRDGDLRLVKGQFVEG